MQDDASADVEKALAECLAIRDHVSQTLETLKTTFEHADGMLNPYSLARKLFVEALAIGQRYRTSCYAFFVCRHDSRGCSEGGVGKQTFPFVEEALRFSENLEKRTCSRCNE